MAVSLAELQQRFAAALRDPAAAAALAGEVHGDGLGAEARLRIYRNNAAAVFVAALERGFPVLRKRVGANYFRQLAHEYRRAHPSCHGDLHHLGRHFPDWIAARHVDTEYAWLGDLARLEWAGEEASVAEYRPPLPLTALAAVPAESLAGLRFRLQPSLRLCASPFPVWSVWRANQGEAAAPPVDPALGAEWVALHCGAEGLELHRLGAPQWRCCAALADRATLGAAFEASGLESADLPALLGWLFAEGLVVELAPPPEPAAPAS